MRKGIFNCEAQGCTEFIGSVDRDHFYIIGSIGKSSFGADGQQIGYTPLVYIPYDGWEAGEKRLDDYKRRDGVGTPLFNIGADCFGSWGLSHDTPQPVQRKGPSAKTPETQDGARRKLM